MQVAYQSKHPLKFCELRAANLIRLPRFKNRRGEPAHTDPFGRDWSPADWMVAVVGELGEAANVMKKIRRGDFSATELVGVMSELRKEFADVITYIDLLAVQYGVDLGEAVADKFNEVSDRVSAEVYLWTDSNGAVVVADTQKCPF
jgi:NTP pyrophosphatase (non-canonical NTP hydrolase)